MNCKLYSPDNKFKDFKVVEFPVTLVGLTSVKYLSLDVNLNTNAYIKTLYNGQLMTFEDAQELSSSHRAFKINITDDHTLKIEFKPTVECIYKISNKANIHDRFVVDIHLIEATQLRCCDNESHSEIGRYYICGIFEYCQINHFPSIIDFGAIDINCKCTRNIQIRNSSEKVTCKVIYSKIPEIEASPDKYILMPNTFKTIKIILKPTNLKVVKYFVLKVSTNNQPIANDSEDFIFYKIPMKYSTRYAINLKSYTKESLHNLHENSLIYTYTKNELNTKIKLKEIASKQFKVSKLNTKGKCQKENILPLDCYKYGCDKNILNEYNSTKNICGDSRKIIRLCELFNVILEPYIIQFDRIELFSFDQQQVKIKNKSKYDIILTFLINDCITYTDKHLLTITLNIKAYSEMDINIYCLAFMEGTYNGTFEYTIEQKFCLQHPYTIATANPSLQLKDKFLKFGMVSPDNFIISVPITIYNNFNTNVEYKWEIPDTAPFEVTPKKGKVLLRSSCICNVNYNLSKPTKIKSHEITLVSCGPKNKYISVDINVFTKKHAVGFLQNNILLKDIPLNLEIIKRVELENSSKEFAYFQVMEPFIVGFTIYPMNGVIQPKTFTKLTITIKIPYTLSFNFELNIKINNKDMISLPIIGTVVAPELIIHPKNIHLQRIPSNLNTYVPITIKNMGTTDTLITVPKTIDMFKIYESITIFKQVSYLEIGSGQTKIAYIEIKQKFRQEYDFYLPFIVNNILGPPKRDNESSTTLQYYISKFEKCFEDNPKVTIDKSNREICYCRISGVVTVPWIKFCPDKFEFKQPNESMVISMINESKYRLPITIDMGNLYPNYSLKLLSTDNLILNETKELSIKFKMNSGAKSKLYLTFHPEGKGTFISVAEFYIDKQLSIPYYNLTLVGKNEFATLIPSTYKLVFPPSLVATKISKIIELNIEGEHNLESFNYNTVNNNIIVTFVKVMVLEKYDIKTTQVVINISITSDTVCTNKSSIVFDHDIGCNCEVQICYCFTLCPLTMHANSVIDINKHSYPYYPPKEEANLYRYMNVCSEFLENWLFVQGFRKDFFPVLPDSMYIVSINLSSQKNKTINMNVSYLFFLRRIMGPLIKLIPKITLPDTDSSYRNILEIHDTYREIITLLQSRGADIWFLQAEYLLSYDQFEIYCENIFEADKGEQEFRKMLLNNEKLFYNLSKQCWIDFVLQTYKVFVMDSCFFDCVCKNIQNRTVLNIIIEWFNQQIEKQQNKLLKMLNFNKCITNITSDLSDGIAVTAAILNHCPFLEKHFYNFIKIDESNKDASIIHNACLIIEALNILKINFPLVTTDFFKPIFLQMLFLSIHLYIVLPLYNPKEVIYFNPPLSINSYREITLYSATHETVSYNSFLLNNVNNAFTVDKSLSHAIKKKNTFIVKFQANFIGETNTVLILQGSNKIRLFDTYVVFYLRGCVGSLIPHKKVKIICPLYRTNKSDIMLTSPYNENADYKIFILDEEPTISTKIVFDNKPKFFVRRLNLIEKLIRMKGQPQGNSIQEVIEQKFSVNVTCMSTRIENTWIWFKSVIGDFFIKVTIQPHWDHALETLQVQLRSWPLDPCNCGECCECYRTTVVSIAQSNDLMRKCLRTALQENASEVMMKIFDDLIETINGKEILRMLLEEGGTDNSEVAHILRRKTVYRITSKKLQPRLNSVTFTHPFDGVIEVPVTLPATGGADKYTITLTSDCGMDIRVYRLSFVGNEII